MQGTAHEGSSDGSEDDAEQAVQVPIRKVLVAWLRAQLAFLSSAFAPEAAPSELNLPRTAVLAFLENKQLGISARCTFQWTLTAAKAHARVKPEDTVLAHMTFTPVAPVPFRVSNPIMAIQRWAREVFWKAPPHAQVHAVASGSPMPAGKGWLDQELRKILAVALPYLALDSQLFWKSSAVPPPGGLLVVGGKGSGKTALLERSAAVLAEHPTTRCHVSRINCGLMAGDKPKKVRNSRKYFERPRHGSSSIQHYRGREACVGGQVAQELPDYIAAACTSCSALR